VSRRSPGAHHLGVRSRQENDVTRGEQDEALTRIAMEYIEMPDLKLTAAQARRLWNISSEVCDMALAALVARGFLMQTRTGAFLRRTSGAPTPLRQAS
jgi:hypothetical protein